MYKSDWILVFLKRVPILEDFKVFGNLENFIIKFFVKSQELGNEK